MTSRCTSDDLTPVRPTRLAPFRLRASSWLARVLRSPGPPPEVAPFAPFTMFAWCAGLFILGILGGIVVAAFIAQVSS